MFPRPLLLTVLFAISVSPCAWALTPGPKVVAGGVGDFNDIAGDRLGRSVIVWEGADGIYGRLYAPDGSPIRFLNMPLEGKHLPSVAMNADGRFVVTASGPASLDPQDYSVFVQCFNTDGSLRGPRIEIEGNHYLIESFPTAVAMNGTGAFVVGWNGQEGGLTHSGIHVQRFDADCNHVGGEILVVPISTQADTQALAALVMGEDGYFEAIWHRAQFGSGTSIWLQRYDANDVALGSSVQVNTLATDPTYGVSVGRTRRGGFVVGWGSFDSNSSFARRFDRFGNPLDAAEYVLSTTNKRQVTIAMDDSGDTVAAWAVTAGDPSCIALPEPGCTTGPASGMLLAQRFTAPPAAHGDPFMVVLPRANQLVRLPRLLMDGEGNFTVLWHESPISDSPYDQGWGSGYFRQYRHDAQNNRLAVSTSSGAYSPTPAAGGPAGTYSFDARFCNTSQATLSNLSSRTVNLTGGDTLVNRTRDGTGSQPGGAGSSLDFPKTGAYADGLLAPGECNDVHYVIGLAARVPFSFSVDVIGDQGNIPTPANALLNPPPPVQLANSVAP
jgi:hypothetical protein